MKMNRVLTAILIMMFGSLSNQAQNVSPLQVVNKKDRPSLSVDYSQTVEFKIASNKTIYRIGDIIKITYAMLNKSENDIFLREFEPIITSINSEGKKSNSEKYFIVDYRITPEVFELTEPNRLIVKSEYFHIGCNDKKFNRIFDSSESEKLIFEKNLFAQIDTPCLRITQTGLYTIKANQNNQFVIQSEAESAKRTATGNIESNSLKIKIVK